MNYSLARGSLDAITLPQSNQLFVVVGGQSAHARLMDLAARLSLAGHLLILDGGNRANPYPLARELRRLTSDPVKALNRIQIARAFTCHQVVALLEQTLEDRRGTRPVLILDLLSTFYDESISLVESQRLLERGLRSIRILNQSAPVVISSRPPLAEFPQRRVFLARICAVASRVWEEAPIPNTAPLQMVLPGL